MVEQCNKSLKNREILFDVKVCDKTRPHFEEHRDKGWKIGIYCICEYNYLVIDFTKKGN